MYQWYTKYMYWLTAEETSQEQCDIRQLRTDLRDLTEIIVNPKTTTTTESIVLVANLLSYYTKCLFYLFI